MFKHLESVTEWGIFASRWLLAPLYLGLIVGQIFFSVTFFRSALWEAACITGPSASGSEKGMPSSTISQPHLARRGTTSRVASRLG